MTFDMLTLEASASVKYKSIDLSKLEVSRLVLRSAATVIAEDFELYSLYLTMEGGSYFDLSNKGESPQMGSGAGGIIDGFSTGAGHGGHAGGRIVDDEADVAAGVGAAYGSFYKPVEFGSGGGGTNVCILIQLHNIMWLHLLQYIFRLDVVEAEFHFSLHGTLIWEDQFLLTEVMLLEALEVDLADQFIQLRVISVNFKLNTDYLNAKLSATLSGHGRFAANGGSGAGNGGGGAGGRIAVFSSIKSTFTGQFRSA